MATGTIKKPFIVKKVTTAETTLAANSTTWITVPVPSGYTALGVVGYYFDGTGNTLVHLYAVSGTSLAARNIGSSQAKFTVDVDLLLIKN